MRETDNWPFIEAKWYQKWEAPTRRPVRVVVIHDMEFVEKADSAEVIAHDFATRKADNKGSAHINVDNNSIVQCVRDNDIAFAAPGCNADGIQIELAGYMKQSPAEWLDTYGIALLALGADATAQYLLKYNLPPIHLSNAQLLAGQKGIVGHAQVSQVYKKSTHQDPGPNFPWTYFMNHVVSAYQSRS